MKKMPTVLIALLLILTFVSVVLALDVAVTKRGKKYHSLTCPLLAGKRNEVMDEKQARAKGLNPCEKCIKQRSPMPVDPVLTAPAQDIK